MQRRQSWAKTAGGMRLTVLLMLLLSSARACFFGRACLSGTRLAALGQRAAGTRALLCAGSIGRACDSGLFTAAQMEYMRASRESCDARDVVWHRAVTRLVRVREHENEPDHARNNAIMHALEDAQDADRNATAKAKAHGRGRRRG